MSFFTPEAATLAPWSISKAKTGVQCPWKFNSQYTRRTEVPKGKEVELDDSNLRVGSAVHKYAEEIARGRLGELAEEIAIDEGSLLNEEEEAFRGMIESVNSFEETLAKFKKNKNVTKDLIESKFGVDKNLKSTTFFSKDVFLRGVMDRVLVVNDTTAVIIDLKTGNFPSLKYAKEQIDAYSLLAFCTWPTVTSVRPALYFASTGDLLWADKIKRSDFEDLSNHPTISYINSAAERAATDEIVPGKYCSWCQYKVICLEERKLRREAKKASGK